jgi:hypothetical protein
MGRRYDMGRGIAMVTVARITLDPTTNKSRMPERSTEVRKTSGSVAAGEALWSSRADAAAKFVCVLQIAR